jgi:uncharacterized protein YbaP (TraB family)
MMLGRFIVALLLGAAVTHVCAEEAPKPSFLWEVKSGSETAYLYGAPGLGNISLYPTPFWSEAAYTRSAVLAVEADMSDEKKMAEETKGLYYPEGDSLKNHLSPELYTEVDDFHAAMGLPMTSSDRMKPYALTVGLLNKEAKTVGLDPGYDASFYFISKAQADNKPVVEVEGVARELETLESLPLAYQEEMLKLAVESAAKGEWAKQLQDEVSAYHSSDLEFYATLDAKSYESYAHGKEIRAHLVESRHPAIADKIGEFLKSGKVHFVVLSAGHFVGPNTLLDELKKRGYSVQRL